MSIYPMVRSATQKTIIFIPENVDSKTYQKLLLTRETNYQCCTRACFSPKNARPKSIFDARACQMLNFLMLDANEPLKIGKFWQKQRIFSQIPGQKLYNVEFSNARACSSLNLHFRACSNLLDTRFFHTRCNTNTHSVRKRHKKTASHYGNES